MNRHAKDNAGFALTAGIILLVYGFYFGVGSFIDHGPFYVFLIHLFKWTVRLSGLAFLVVAGVCWSGERVGLILDAVLSLTCGGIMLACVVGWFYYEKGVDVFNVMAVLLGIMIARSGYANLLLFKQSGGAIMDHQVVAPVAQPPAVLISSDILPKEGEAPPAEGYLAALAREKDETPKS